MTAGLARCRLCLGQKGKRAEPAAGRGEGAFRQRGHHGQRQKSHKGPVGEVKRQSAGQQPNAQSAESRRGHGGPGGRKGKVCEAEELACVLEPLGETIWMVEQ